MSVQQVTTIARPKIRAKICRAPSRARAPVGFHGRMGLALTWTSARPASAPPLRFARIRRGLSPALAPKGSAMYWEMELNANTAATPFIGTGFHR